MEAIRITGKAYKALDGLTSNDTTRHSLSSVWAKGDRLYASNSYVAARYTFNDSDVGEVGVMLNEVIANTVKATDDVIISDEGATICNRRGARLLTLAHCDDECLRMPSFDGVFDTDWDATSDETVVDPKLIEQIAKVAKAVNGDISMKSDGRRFFGNIETCDGCIDFIIMGKNNSRR